MTPTPEANGTADGTRTGRRDWTGGRIGGDEDPAPVGSPATGTGGRPDE
jgi:hypothetical protein